MIHRAPKRLPAVLAALAIAEVHPHGVSRALRDCAHEADDGARLACFDRELARESAKAETAPVAEEPSPEQPLSAVVTRVAERSDGTFVVTLDNGQVWAQL